MHYQIRYLVYPRSITKHFVRDLATPHFFLWNNESIMDINKVLINKLKRSKSKYINNKVSTSVIIHIHLIYITSVFCIRNLGEGA